MTIYDTPLHTLQGESTSLGDYRGKTLLVVNVASKCGLTPQYEGLERLQKTYGDRGFSVIGFPCNQFGDRSRAARRRSPRSAPPPTESPSR